MQGKSTLVVKFFSVDNNTILVIFLTLCKKFSHYLLTILLSKYISQPMTNFLNFFSRDAALDPLYWISYKSGKCTTITSVQPNELQRTTARTLTLVIDNLPTLEGQFLCVFQALGKTLVTNATRTSNGVSNIECFGR